MRNILIFVESRYKVDRKKIRDVVDNYCRGQNLPKNLEISIAIVGNRKMTRYNQKYCQRNEPTTVLSFALEDSQKSEKGFVYAPDNILRLGDIIISYPQAVERAAEDNMLVDDKINELVIHGLKSLIGRE